MSSVTSSCSSCGRSISGGELLYSPEGNPLCPACNAQQELLQLDIRAAGNIRKSAYSALGLALLSLVFNPIFIITVMAISSGLYAIRSFRPDNERFSRHVASARGRILTCAYVAIVLAALIAAAPFLNLTGRRPV